MRSSIILTITGWDAKIWEERFREQDPGRDVRLWPDQVGNPSEIAYACAWKPPAGWSTHFANLKVIFSLGAGVDHLLGDPTLPDLPIVRIVDADLTQRMTEYVVLHTLIYHRRQRIYDDQQRRRIWHEVNQPNASEVAVGVMGLGVMGGAAAEALARLGFKVAGWSSTPKVLPGLTTYAGPNELKAFLADTEILICLLPHTPATQGILNIRLFRGLKRDGALGGAYLINAGRGALQIDHDILTALDDGALAAATLDVFPQEPLPSRSPFWAHPKVTITPHNAAVSDPRALAGNVLAQIRRFEQGLPLENVVDRQAGY